MPKLNATQKSVDRLRKQGYLCANVEKYNAFTKRKNDLYGMIDILGIKEGETIAVQTTSKSNVNARVKKILEHENYSIVQSAGWKIVVHGWFKQKNGRYDLVEIAL